MFLFSLSLMLLEPSRIRANESVLAMTPVSISSIVGACQLAIPDGTQIMVVFVFQ